MIIKPWFEYYAEAITTLTSSLVADLANHDEYVIFEKNDRFGTMHYIAYAASEEQIIEAFDLQPSLNHHFTESTTIFVLKDCTRSEKFKARFLLEFIKYDQFRLTTKLLREIINSR